MKPLEFHDPGKLIDNDLKLVLVEKYPGDPAINHAPAYKFKMTPVDQDEEIGRTGLNYGAAPFPPPAGHPERANTAVVQGPVVIIPAGAMDKDAAIQLLAWMMSPEIVAQETYANSSLPTSRAAAQDPRFQQIPNFEVFMGLLDHPNAAHIATTSISLELNQVLSEVEKELLHEGGDPASLLNEVQAEFAPWLKGAVGYHDGP